jgi:ABC-type spermidine/putrescine transport system permease subunit II
VLVGLTLVAPILALLARSFVTADGVGLSAWTRVLGQPINQRAIITSLELGLTCAAISVLIGTPLAWLISRMVAGPRAAWLGLLNVAAHFGGIGLAFAYIATLGVFGMATLLLRDAGLAFNPPARDSFAALVITYEHANIPLYVLLLVPAMAMLRDEWSEAAAASSATRWQFWQRIGLPVLAPFIGAGFVLAFTWSIGIFGIAYALAGQSAALPIKLITLQIGQALSDDAVHGPERAAVLSVVLMVLAIGALLLYRRLLARGTRWLSSGSIGIDPTTRSRPLIRRRARFVPIALFTAFAIYLCLPIIAVALYSIATRWTSSVLPDGYTLAHWVETFRSARVLGAFATSLTLGAWTTLLVIALTVPAVYWARTRNPRIRPVLEAAAVIPFALPFVVIGFALLHFSGIFVPRLQGTYPLLVLAYVAISFPFAYWAIDSAMAAADVRRLSEVAAACGASQWQTLRRVVLPNIRAGITTAALLVFALAIGEFALVKVLASSVLTIPVWSAAAINATGGSFAPLSVVTTVVFVLLFVLSAAVAYVNRGRLTQQMPGIGEGGLGSGQ